MENGTLLAVGKLGIVQQNHAAHGTEAIPYTFGSLHHFDHTRTGIV